jgi:rhamnose transport system permease protein
MAAAIEAGRGSRLLGRTRSALLGHEGVLALILVLALALLATQTDRFLTTDNLLNQGRLVAEIGLVALPMTLIIVTAGIDLSVGSIMGLSAILLGYGWKNLGLPLELSIALAVAAGGLAGFVNGWFIARVGVPPLIQTLATLALYRGLAEGSARRGPCAATPNGSSGSARATSSACPPSSGSWPSRPWPRASCWRARRSAGRSTSSATTRPRRASRASRSGA